MLREMLNLTADQTKQLDDLQKEVDQKLAKILTDDQKRQLREMRNRGPGRAGGRGPGGPGGGPRDGAADRGPDAPRGERPGGGEPPPPPPPQGERPE